MLLQRSYQWALALLFAGLSASCATLSTPQTVRPEALADIPTLTVHPPFIDEYACTEHWVGQLTGIGDALGADCFVTRLVTQENGGAIARAFASTGLTNEDWYSYQAPVLAPISGKVIRVVDQNAIINAPGQPANTPANLIAIENAFGERVLIAHLTSLKVNRGDKVQAGDVIALVGNNGFSRSPHIHIGAWKDNTPYQIRFDLLAKSRLRGD